MPVKNSFRGAIILQRFSTPLLVVAVALLGGEGRILMQRRRIGAEHGGLWEFPGGKVEPGESLESAALRELDEELGICLDRASLEPVSFAGGPLASPDRQGGIVILLYICREWTGEPHCREGEEIRWCAPGDLAGLDMPPLDYPLARALVSTLRQKSR